MKEDRRKKILQWSLLSICLVLFVVVMLFNFFLKAKSEGINYNQDDMAAVAEFYAEKVYGEFKIVESAGKTAAFLLAETEKIVPEDVVKAAEALMENTSVYQVIYNQGDGTGICQDGSQIDLTGYSYFRNFYQTSTVRYTHLAEDEITGREAILIVIPLRQNTRRNLLLYYPVERMQDILKVSGKFDSASFAALVDADGYFLAHGDVESEFLAGENLWENVDDEYRSIISRAKIQIISQISGILEVKSQGEESTFVYSPVKGYAWALVLGVNQEYVERQEIQHWKTISEMFYQLFSVVIVFVLFGMCISLITRKRNAEKARVLREKADTDLLTGLNNKLATERKIKEYIKENPKAMGMMFILDIDNFKKINDTMGHAFGDEVLRELGRQIGSVFRVTDIIGRAGGDEFIIFLKFLKDDSNTLKEARKLANFFKDFTVGEYVKYTATASIGAAVFPAHGSDFESLYKAADQALYKAKRRGKNQLAFFDDRDRQSEVETE